MFPEGDFTCSADCPRGICSGPPPVCFLFLTHFRFRVPPSPNPTQFSHVSGLQPQNPAPETPRTHWAGFVVWGSAGGVRDQINLSEG